MLKSENKKSVQKLGICSIGATICTCRESLFLPNAGFFVLSSTLDMAGEQWISGFVRDWNIMVTQYQPRDMSFVLAQIDNLDFTLSPESL